MNLCRARLRAAVGWRAAFTLAMLLAVLTGLSGGGSCLGVGVARAAAPPAADQTAAGPKVTDRKSGDGLVAIPALTRHVTDLTGTLSADQLGALEARLSEFEARKGSQVAVLLLPSTQPEVIEQYGIRLAEQWKLGRKKTDDGAILLVAKDDHAVRIEVGYGLEGALTDVAAHRIIEETITPLFRSGDFAGGISAGLDRMLKLIDGEALPPPAPRAAAPDELGGLQHLLPLGLVVAVVAGGIFRALFGHLLGAGVTGLLVGALIWFLTSLVPMAVLAALVSFVFVLLGGGSGAGMWYGGGGGFGGGAGGSGGGFSGGGGDFGGGGASGRW